MEREINKVRFIKKPIAEIRAEVEEFAGRIYNDPPTELIDIAVAAIAKEWDEAEQAYNFWWESQKRYAAEELRKSKEAAEARNAQF